MTRNLIDAEQVARRLGVKRETVYAYVSRGLLPRRLSEDGRQSLFASADVELLAKRGRPRQGSARQGAVEVSLATAITNIRPERLTFRGCDAAELSRDTSFERVALLLWTGSLAEPEEFTIAAAKLAVAQRAVRALPRTAGALEQLCTAVAALASVHPLRVDLALNAVTAHARALLATYPSVLTRLAPAAAKSAHFPFAARLFPCLSRLPATPARVALLNSALVLLADHELATSTLAARVAASTRADPFAVVLAGLGAISGPYHGKAAVHIQRMLLEAERIGAERAVADALQSLPSLPGFGHPVYTGVDPRAACLFTQLARVERPAQRERIAALVAAAKATSGAEPNVDFALAATAWVLEMPLGASEAIFAVARTAGFIAHALEEYGEQPLRFRARALYVGT